MASDVDDLVREASDPTTPPERLTEIRWWIRRTAIQRLPDDMADVYAVQAALLGNSSCPLDMLREALRRGDTRFKQAWYNPATAMLLLAEPLPEYRDAAWRLLRAMCRERAVLPRFGLRPGGLDVDVAEWAATDVSGSYSPVTRRDEAEVRDFACRLAGLFGLPWADDQAARPAS